MKHIVLFQLIEEMSAEERKKLMTRFKEGIEALPLTIPAIQSIEVGFNENPTESWDMALVGEFASLADIEAYALHPDHIAVAQTLKGFVKGRSCVDCQ